MSDSLKVALPTDERELRALALQRAVEWGKYLSATEAVEVAEAFLRFLRPEAPVCVSDGVTCCGKTWYADSIGFRKHLASHGPTYQRFAR